MLRKTVVAQSLALAFGLGMAGMAVVPAAYAQSNTTGTIYGQVSTAAGTDTKAAWLAKATAAGLTLQAWIEQRCNAKR